MKGEVSTTTNTQRGEGMGERLRAEFRISEPHRVSPCSCPGHRGRLGFLLFSVGRQRAGCVFSKAVPDVDAWRVCLGRGGGVAGTGRCRLLPGLPGPPPGAQEVNRAASQSRFAVIRKSGDREEDTQTCRSLIAGGATLPVLGGCHVSIWGKTCLSTLLL